MRTKFAVFAHNRCNPYRLTELNDTSVRQENVNKTQMTF